MVTRIGTVSSRLHRAHRRLRGLLRDHAAARASHHGRASPGTLRVRISLFAVFRCLSRHRQVPLAVA
jgi:hypothetical protein